MLTDFCCFNYVTVQCHVVGRVAQSVQRLATSWMVWGSNPRGGEIFCTCPSQPWSPPSFLHNGYRVFPGGKERLGRDADPSPPSSAVVMKEQSYTSTPPMGHTACTEPQCLYMGALYLTVELYLYSPYGPYGLYRASVTVQGCTLLYSRAIPLPPLWTVRPVHSLSATFTLFCLVRENLTVVSQVSIGPEVPLLGCWSDCNLPSFGVFTLFLGQLHSCHTVETISYS